MANSAGNAFNYIYLKNMCFNASSTVILLFGSGSIHFLIKSNNEGYEAN